MSVKAKILGAAALIPGVYSDIDEPEVDDELAARADDPADEVLHCLPSPDDPAST